tara:strand:+ start:415 stop:582 length:168 start_codon:yes stop_codon:yes gene_type:complete
VGFDKTIEVFAELSVLCMVMFLAAFFCYRVILLPKAAGETIKKIHEVEEILSEKR